MELSNFIESLVNEGTVTVKGTLISFTEKDIQQTAITLQHYYLEDSLEMPYSAPAFSKDAALWAAEYFYKAVQLVVLRDEKEETVKQVLVPYHNQINPESIYSADLVLRYLPALFDLAKGLAPADLLVKELRTIAIQWPFSSVGIAMDEPVNNDIIFSSASLKQAYIDRIIQKQDKKRISGEAIKTLLYETTGKYAISIWPYLETVLNN